MLASLVLACVLSAPAEPARPVELTPTEERLIAAINGYRARHGLRPLVVHGDLLARARGHAGWMAAYRSMVHSAGAIECIAAGQPTPEAAAATWYASPPHRAIMLGNYRYLGAAGAGRAGHYWCLQVSGVSLPKGPLIQPLQQPVWHLRRRR